jgi:isopentenyl-diphosphate delta-isomerase type 1
MADEWLDILDNDHRVIGQALRSEVHQRGWRHRGVDMFLFTREGKLLVQTRTATRATFPSALDCSVAEHVRAGEDFWQAAVRGMKEEIGIEGITLEPLLDFSHSNSPTDHETARLFRGSVDPARVHFDPEEVARVDYYTLAELDALISEGKTPFSHWFEQLLKWYLGKPHELQILKIHEPATHKQE